MGLTFIDISPILCDGINHQWEMVGGRPCPKGYSDCSQPVYQCEIASCGEYDYGEEDGPAYNVGGYL